MKRSFSVKYLLKSAIVLSLLLSVSIVQATETTNYKTEIISLKYISPADLEDLLALDNSKTGYGKFLIGSHEILTRINTATNQILLTGPEESLKMAKDIIESMDVAPRQIIIEAKIVEINNEKSDELGLDWQYLLDESYAEIYIQKTDSEKKTNDIKTTFEDYDKRRRIQSNARLGDFLKIIQESGSGKIINVPHIVTTNNKKGTIFDGQKLRYVSNLSSYANIYQTEEITAGLMLSVTPSLGTSGYLKLNVNAKFTALEFAHNINQSMDRSQPIESGQTLENTVIVKDGESILLGGFKKTEHFNSKRKTPILGTILPFLFSRTVQSEITKDVLVILTPKIIDLDIPDIPDIPEYE